MKLINIYTKLNNIYMKLISLILSLVAPKCLRTVRFHALFTIKIIYSMLKTKGPSIFIIFKRADPLHSKKTTHYST